MIRLKELREEKGLNRRELAEAVGLKYTTYLNYEKEDREPDSETLIKLANYFCVSVDYLIGRTESREKPVRAPDELDELREAMRDREDMKILFKLAKNAKASDIWQASALLQKLKEESENK